MADQKLKLEDLIEEMPVIPQDPDRIELVGIVGGGVMGSGIAQAVSQAGLDVILVEKEEEALERCFKRLNDTMDREIQRWGMTTSEKKGILQRIKGTTNLEDLAECQIVIEAVDEDLNLKKSILKKLDTICPPETIFASNTSTLSLSKIASDTKRGDKVIGVHFLHPVPKVPLVEVVRGIETSDDTTRKTKVFARKLGKTPVEVFEYPGFVTTRVIVPFLNEAIHILMEGLATADGIDTAMKLGYNLPIGPLELADSMGLDEVLAWMDTLWRDLGEPRYRPCPLLRKYVREGKLGKKSLEGFFKYDEYGRKLQ
ncbi:MAG: 3-hydroxyacyl-CoA dehydrogenase NAD-binding domain-containing protein [Ignavibacteria bacterium]|nr:3-hydroxyacyl-CoA dehydrogenase NAD-binding domain-containing protein [Ignavibacteria bacterium]